MMMNETEKLKDHEEIGAVSVTSGLDFACDQILAYTAIVMIAYLVALTGSVHYCRTSLIRSRLVF